MGLLTTLFERRATLGSSFHVSQEPPAWVSRWGAWETASGATVSESTALEVMAVFACVRVLAESVAFLPLHVYRRLSPRGKERAPDHSLYPILHLKPNGEMTSFELREVLMGHLALWGNAYAEIQINGAGEVIGLWPLRPDKMQVGRADGVLEYAYTLPKPDKNGKPGYRFRPDQVLHLRGLGFNGIVGFSPIQLARQAIGLALATEEFGARFFGNGAVPGVVLQHPGQLSDQAHRRLRESWEKRHQGLSASHRVAVLEEGLTIQEIGVPPDAAQFLATRKFQRTEIASLYRVPPHMIGDLERATFSNIEQQSLDFVQNTLGPWLVRWEQAIDTRLLSSADQLKYFAQFLVDGLLRGDTAARFAAYSIGRQNGWLSANDVREMENLNPIEGGDLYMVPLNMVPAGEAGQFGSTEPAANAPPQTEGDGERSVALELRDYGQSRHRLAVAWRRQYFEAAGRVIRREANDVANAAGRFAKRGDLAGFEVWLGDYYTEHRGIVAGAMRPIAWSYGELVAAEVAGELGGRGMATTAEVREMPTEVEPFAQSYIEAYSRRHVAKSKDRALEIVRAAQAAGEPWFEALEAELDGWRKARPQQIAGGESVRFHNALAVALYGFAGVRRLRWVAIGQSCPYCNSLNGRIVGIRGEFLTGGTDFEPEGAERPLKVSRNVKHAPAHDGCDCVTMAA